MCCTLMLVLVLVLMPVLAQDSVLQRAVAHVPALLLHVHPPKLKSLPFVPQEMLQLAQLLQLLQLAQLLQLLLAEHLQSSQVAWLRL